MDTGPLAPGPSLGFQYNTPHHHLTTTTMPNLQLTGSGTRSEAARGHCNTTISTTILTATSQTLITTRQVGAPGSGSATDQLYAFTWLRREPGGALTHGTGFCSLPCTCDLCRQVGHQSTVQLYLLVPAKDLWMHRLGCAGYWAPSSWQLHWATGAHLFCLRCRPVVLVYTHDANACSPSAGLYC